MPEKNPNPQRGAAGNESAVRSTSTAPGANKGESLSEKVTGPEPAAKVPAPTPVGTKSAAVRLLTRSVAGKKTVVPKGQSQRVADTAKPSQKPQAGGGRRGPRRGASKGR